MKASARLCCEGFLEVVAGEEAGRCGMERMDQEHSGRLGEKMGGSPEVVYKG